MTALLGMSLGMQAEGQLTVKKVARNAVRIQYTDGQVKNDLPDWIYVKQDEVSQCDLKVEVKGQRLSVKDKNGKTVFTATRHEMKDGEATLTFTSPKDECLFGLGQFQDGYSNVRGLSRRLTQVNTQISLPMLISNKGYGILWNNYGLTDFNPCSEQVSLTVSQTGAATGPAQEVNVTTTEGNRREMRRNNTFEATIDIAKTGDYALLLDVGQKMARRHNLVIDGQTVIDAQNMWLPPTASAIVNLKKGRHTLKAELSGGDKPTLYYKQVNDETVFRSPVATAVDYTVFIGSADEIIAAYRELTGPCPTMPAWALGYIHCRERFHSSEEILQTANRFRQEQIPLDVIVQDWQYWGKYGWNPFSLIDPSNGIRVVTLISGEKLRNGRLCRPK